MVVEVAELVGVGERAPAEDGSEGLAVAELDDGHAHEEPVPYAAGPAVRSRSARQRVRATRPPCDAADLGERRDAGDREPDAVVAQREHALADRHRLDLARRRADQSAISSVIVKTSNSAHPAAVARVGALGAADGSIEPRSPYDSGTPQRPQLLRVRRVLLGARLCTGAARVAGRRCS